MTLFFKLLFSIVMVSSSSVLFGKVVPIVYGRCSAAGRELYMSLDCGDGYKQFKTDALMKLRMSPTVCVRFILHTSLMRYQIKRSLSSVLVQATHRVPSASLIWMLVFG